MWINKIFSPARQCARKGHTESVEQTRSGYMKPWHYEEQTGKKVWRSTAVSVRQSRDQCRRCKAGLSEWEITLGEGIQELTLNTDVYALLAEHGEVWTR